MTETLQPKSNQHSRLTLIDLFDFLLWAGIVWAGLTFKVWDPILIGWSLLLIGVAGAVTKGITLFVTRPKLTLIEGLEYLCLALICAIIFSYCLANCDVTLPFGIATVGAVIAGVLILRKYLGKESVLLLFRSFIYQRKILFIPLEIAIGFFGWIMFSNLYFLSLVEGAYSLIDGLGRSIFFLGLPTVIVPVVFFAKKRNWIGIGITTAILINMGIWIVLFLMNGGLTAPISLWEIISAVLLPYPLGFILYAQ